MTKTQGWVLVLGLLSICAVATVVLLSMVRSPWEEILSLPEKAATSAAEIARPTPTFYPDTVTVVHQVQSLAKLETVQYSVEIIIPAETNQGPFGFLFGDRLLLVAHGRVIAGIDLGRVQAADILVDSEHGIVSLVLPPAEIFSVALVNDKTYVYSRESAVFAPSHKDLETLARQEAEKRIRAAALSDGILDSAMTNGQAFLQRFILALGFRQVVFLVASPTPESAPESTPTMTATRTATATP